MREKQPQMGHWAISLVFSRQRQSDLVIILIVNVPLLLIVTSDPRCELYSYKNILNFFSGGILFSFNDLKQNPGSGSSC